MLSESAPRILVGQLWKSHDPRTPRILLVTYLFDDGSVQLTNTETARRTRAYPHRFNGRANGYKLIKDVEPRVASPLPPLGERP